MRTILTEIYFHQQTSNLQSIPRGMPFQSRRPLRGSFLEIGRTAAQAEPVPLELHRMVKPGSQVSD